MEFRLIPYHWISLCMLVVLTALYSSVRKRRSARGAPYFLIALLLIMIWIMGQALELASVDLAGQIFWANMQYLSSYFTPVAYLYMVLQFLGLEKWIENRPLRAMLILMAVAANVLVWTNGLHGLWRQSVYLDTAGTFPVIGRVYGPLYYVFAGYNLALSVAILVILAAGLRQKTHLRQAQVAALFLGLLLPVCSVVLYVSGLARPRVDATPLVIGVSGLILSLGIFRYQLFDIVTVAYSKIVHEMSTGIIVVDDEGGVLEINAAARSMLPISAPQPIGARVDALLEDCPQLLQLYGEQLDGTREMVCETEEGRYYYEITLKRLENALCRVVGWIFQIYNITKRKLEEEKILEMAYRDELTGLSNRSHFQKMFLEELTHARLTGTGFAVAYLDMDDFKVINDTLGHAAGDEYLREVANRLQGALRESDLIARYGGDEYAILLPTVGAEEKLESVREKILAAFRRDFVYRDRAIPMRASIGFSVYPRDGTSMLTLMNRADKAMYEAKQRNKEAPRPALGETGAGPAE